MCDTLVATGSVTADGVTLFAKNSDRDPNEAHHLLRVPAADHAPGSVVRCTYIEIPQVAHTYAVLLAKPFWIWGGEMGTNEHGVTIGNEAVFTKDPYGKEDGLIGMDFLRLALERAAAAREAVEVITALLKEHGQSGSCAYGKDLYYHNSFLIADPTSAWVLETSASNWVAKEVEGAYTISNCLTIRDDWDLASPELVSHAREAGWCQDPQAFDFARCYAEGIEAKFLAGRGRRNRTMEILTSQAGDITPAAMAAALRDHGEAADDDWAPDDHLSRATVCMHAGGPGRDSQTTGSMVSHLHPSHLTHFFTGTAAPCTSLFRPAWVDCDLPDTGPKPDGTYDHAALFWRHEALHRATLTDYARLIRSYAPERDTLEAAFVTQALRTADRPAAERKAFEARCFQEADAAEARWLEALATDKMAQQWTGPYAAAWRRRNREAGLPQM